MTTIGGPVKYQAVETYTSNNTNNNPYGLNNEVYDDEMGNKKKNSKV